MLFRSTLWIQDSEITPATQVGLTVKSGALLLDGADSLRIGNMRLTATGLTSINPASPITLGDNTFTNYVELQAGGIKFKDGTFQSTAQAAGPKGDQGSPGAPGTPGAQGAPGADERDGSPVANYHEQPLCLKNGGQIVFGTCTSNSPNDVTITVYVKN